MKNSTTSTSANLPQLPMFPPHMHPGIPLGFFPPASNLPLHMSQHLNQIQKQSTPQPQPQEKKPISRSSSKSKNTVPATIPTVQVEQGIEYITFTYSVKGVSKEYKIRTDIDSVEVENEDFKQANCVYPRAYVPKEKYSGNRWDYETTVNTLGWKLAWLNQDALCGKRGLIQRAVDSYRNRFPEMRSRRVVRQEKLIKGTLRKRSERPSDAPDSPILPSPPLKKDKKSKTSKSITFEIIVNGQPEKQKMKCDIDQVLIEEIPNEFQKSNSVFPSIVDSGEQTTKVSEKKELNKIAIKLAWLNSNLAGRIGLLQRALDCYRSKFMEKPRRGKRAVEQVNSGMLFDSSDYDSSCSLSDQEAAELLQTLG